VERVLAPELKPGQIVVMDNLSSHKGSRVRELIEERGCTLLYLPPYSPDLTWDEKVRDRETPHDFYDGERTESEGRRTMSTQHNFTAGIDLGDRYSHLCLLDVENGEVIEESPIATSREASQRRFSGA
jgi:hypothetical protein